MSLGRESGIITYIVCCIHNKAAQPGDPKPQTFISHSSRGQKSKIEVLAGWVPFGGSLKENLSFLLASGG